MTGVVELGREEAVAAFCAVLVSLTSGSSWFVWSPESFEEDGVGSDVVDGPDEGIIRVGKGVKSPGKDGREEPVVEGCTVLVSLVDGTSCVQFPV